jgi:hypothetical protein
MKFASDIGSEAATIFFAPVLSRARLSTSTSEADIPLTYTDTRTSQLKSPRLPYRRRSPEEAGDDEAIRHNGHGGPTAGVAGRTGDDA